MKKIYEAFQSITPNDFEKIKENIEIRNEEVSVQMETKKKKQYYKIGLVALTCSIIIVFSFFFNHDHIVFATIGVDVNPSIELEINEKEEIIQVITHNDDGQKIVGDMELKGTDLNVAVNALIGSMLKEGYIDELKNSLLITVSGKNKLENERLRKEISQNIDEFLKGSQINGSIVSQTLDSNDDLETLAKKYDISTGKAEIIQQLVEKNSLYSFEELKDLSVNDLNILLESNHVDNIQVNGKVSTGNYISETKAKQIVEADAKVSYPVYDKIELDYEDGIMIYEIDFTKESVEYEYELNAINGSIIAKEIKSKKTSSQSQTSNSSLISESQAKSIAMEHAGVSSVTDYKIEKDYDDGVLEYDIEFVSANKKYEYTIHASDGTVLKYEIKEIGEVKISSQEAKQKAMEHAGVSSVTDYKIEKDYDDGVLEYDIEFVSANKKYEYTIRASDGAILKYEVKEVGKVKISSQEAKQKALSHAGVSNNQVKELEVDLEKGYYEVSFETGSHEYEYKIDASSGKIIDYEKELND